jgi:hypothetical protein
VFCNSAGITAQTIPTRGSSCRAIAGMFQINAKRIQCTDEQSDVQAAAG